MNSGTMRIIWIKAYLSSFLIIGIIESGMRVGSTKVSFLLLHYLSHLEYLLKVNFFKGRGLTGEELLLGKIHHPYFQ